MCGVGCVYGLLLACCVKSYVCCACLCLALRVCVVYDESCDVVWCACFCVCVFDCLIVENVIGCCVCESLCGDVW